MKKLKLLIFVAFLLGNINSYSQRVNNVAQNASTSIHINYPESADSDRLILFYSVSDIVTKNIFGDGFKSLIAKREKGGKYNFDFSLTSSNPRSYIVIAKLNNGQSKSDAIANQTISYVILETYQLCKSDKITIDIKKNESFDEGCSSLRNFSFHFSGMGSLKFYLRYKVDSLAYHTDLKSDFLNSDLSYNKSNFEIRKIQSQLFIIEKYKGYLNADDYLELKNHCIFSARSEENLLFHYVIKHNLDRLTKTIKESILAAYLASNNEIKMPIASSLQSFDFGYAEESKMKIISYLKYGLKYRDSLTSVVISNEKGKVREKILLLCLIDEGKFMPDLSERIIAASEIIHSTEYLAEYKKLFRKVSGQFAYNFELPDTSGKIIKLSDYKGKIAFVDFWYTGCVNCLNFYQNELSKIEEKYRNDPDVVFITISIDKVKSLWIKSVMGGKYTSPTALNLFTGGRGSSDKVIEYYDVYSYPQPMIIGKDQKIYQYSYALRTQDGLINAINSLKASR